MANKTGGRKPQTIDQEFGLSTNRSILDFLDQDALSNFPGKDDWRRRVIYSLIQWASDPKSLELMEFCIAYKIPFTTFKDWIARWPDLAQAVNEAKYILASHRRVGSMKRKLDGNYAYKDLHVLDPEWHAINKYHADLKKDEDAKPTTFNINVSKPSVTSKDELRIIVEGTDE